MPADSVKLFKSIHGWARERQRRGAAIKKSRRGAVYNTIPAAFRAQRDPKKSTWWIMYVEDAMQTVRDEEHQHHRQFRNRFRVPWVKFNDLVSEAKTQHI